MNTASRIACNPLKTITSTAFLSLVLLFTPPAFSAMNGAEQKQAFEKGWQAMKNDKLDEAYNIWDKLSKNPNNSPELKRALENNLAVVLMRQKKYEQAQQRLDAALQADKQVARTLDNLNQIYAYQAQQAYKKVFEKTTVKQPKGELLFIELPGDVSVPKETSVAVVSETPAEQKPLSNALFEVTGLVEGWRQAWSSQDVDRYLSFYDPNEFQPKNGMSYRSWEKSRYRNVRNPKYIRIYLDDLKLTELDGGEQVRADFEQRYESDRFRDTIHKFLVWQKDGGDWKIIREEVVYANGD
jgi:hypothetical protein